MHLQQSNSKRNGNTLTHLSKEGQCCPFGRESNAVSFLLFFVVVVVVLGGWHWNIVGGFSLKGPSSNSAVLCDRFVAAVGQCCCQRL